MNKTVKGWLIAAGCLMTVGLILLIISAVMYGGNIKNTIMEEISSVSGGKYSVQEYICDEAAAIERIYLKDSNQDVTFGISPDDNIHVVYYESDHVKYHFSGTNGELKIQSERSSLWYESIFLHLFYDDSKYALQIQIPEANTVNIEAATSNASMTIENIRLAGNSYFRSSNGRIVADGLTSKGEIQLITSNARISASDIQAQSLSCDTSNAQVEVSDITSHGLEVDTSNATIEVGYGTDCEDIYLNTSNGRIQGILTGNQVDYSIKSDTSHGENSLPENQNGGSRKLVVKTSNGRIDIGFSGVDVEEQ